ncbi:hypothetical protein LshimejAT787_0806070 [Lyophyllum shimeji]|uniref:Uncharacterized protein n=1 Tax=Lyophyllum shimeji TaxID=47721 RepID=A0A9P3US18_LYOSH|nr:hypothetical protein LshimejAT787_0806070 [Lyophyllum shimeji]
MSSTSNHGHLLHVSVLQASTSFVLKNAGTSRSLTGSSHSHTVHLSHIVRLENFTVTHMLCGRNTTCQTKTSHRCNLRFLCLIGRARSIFGGL